VGVSGAVESVKVGEESAYLPGPVNAGLFKRCMIDTPWDEEPFRGLDVGYVLLTHGHADHFRQARALRHAGAKIIAPRDEALFVERPDLNRRAMFSWANPPPEMVTSFFRGDSCPVDEFAEDWHSLSVRIIPLPGHSYAQVGYLTADGVLFSGDALYTRELWREYPLPYAIDTGLVRRSLATIRELEFTHLVPGHGAPITQDQADEEAEHHLRRLDELDAILLRLTREPRSTEEVIKGLALELRLRDNLAQYWIAVTVIKGHLSHLAETRRVRFFLRDYMVFWQASPGE
jgi:glyoxylase-like metal-dependent hydrolase (beta-lactamase superfamily II)